MFTFQHQFGWRATIGRLLLLVLLWPGPRPVAHSHELLINESPDLQAIAEHLALYHSENDDSSDGAHFHWVLDYFMHRELGRQCALVDQLCTPVQVSFGDGCEISVPLEWIMVTRYLDESRSWKQACLRGGVDSFCSSYKLRLCQLLCVITC